MRGKTERERKVFRVDVERKKSVTENLDVREVFSRNELDFEYLLLSPFRFASFLTAIVPFSALRLCKQ